MSLRTLPDRRLAYLLLRISFGINLAMHGVNRLAGGVGRFADKLASDFAAVPLPAPLVSAFGHALPAIELLVGVAILVGARLRAALAAGSLVMTVLVFGTALRGDWSTLGIQLVYCLAYHVLLARREDDAFSVDAGRR